MAWSLEQTPDVYQLPTVDIEGVSWLADAAVTSFSLDRELVASVIPGNIRSRQGLSVGAASVEVAFDDRVTPWSKDLTRRVDVDSAARLLVSDGTDDLQLGSWVIAPTSGGLTSNGVSIELLEAQSVGKGITQALEPYWGPLFDDTAPVDPVWAIGRLAAQAGFPAVPPPVNSALLTAPLHGGVVPLSSGYYPKPPYLAAAYAPNGYKVLEGDVVVGLPTGSAAVFSANRALGVETPVRDWMLITGPPSFPSTPRVYLTLDVVGELHVFDASQKWQLKIVNDHVTGTYTLGVSNTATGVVSTVAFIGQSSSATPNRVQVLMRRTRTWDEATGTTWTEFRAAIRATDTFSSWAIDATPAVPLAEGLESINFLAGVEDAAHGVVAPGPGEFAGIQFHPKLELSLWEPAKAHLKPIGGNMGIPFVPPELSAWQGIQDLCSAWLAASIIDNDGILHVLNRDDLSGANSFGEVTDIGQEWTDLPWTLDPADAADRVEVTFSPPQLVEADLGSSTLAPEVWRASEIITVPPMGTIYVPATFADQVAIGVFGKFITPTVPEPLWSERSTATVFDNPQGTGSPLSDSFYVTAVQKTATSAVIQIDSFLNFPIYLVDGNGEPSLILRAQKVATYQTPQIIERGASDTAAVRPLGVDLTPWVQSADEATAIADYLYSRLSGRGLWKASSVRCRLNWSHDIGKVLRMRHAETGLEAKALITKVRLDGQPGAIAQSLDLVLLPWTWNDFDAMTAATSDLDTWAEFDAEYLAAGKKWNDFDADPLWTGA